MKSEFTQPLREMSREAKLRLMEELWDDLCHSGEEPPSPAWHAEVLADRLERVQRGEAEFLDWEQVKGELLRPRE